MDTIHFNQKHAKMVAHRGASYLERENTNAAFVAAGNRSYWGIETDVHVTSDGQLVIIHDDNTGRVGNQKLSVENSTFEELKKVALHDVDGSYTRADLRIGTLAEYISICRKYEKAAVLEIKNTFRKSDIRKVIDVIKEYDYLDKTVFISFVFENLVYIREFLPQQKVQFLCDSCSQDTLDKLVAHKMDIDIYYPSVNAELAAKIKAAGLMLNVWTVDDLKIAEEMDRYGADYITSNKIE